MFNNRGGCILTINQMGFGVFFDLSLNKWLSKQSKCPVVWDFIALIITLLKLLIWRSYHSFYWQNIMRSSIVYWTSHCSSNTPLISTKTPNIHDIGAKLNCGWSHQQGSKQYDPVKWTFCNRLSPAKGHVKVQTTVSAPGSLFTKRTDGKARSREIRCNKDRIAVKFDRHLGYTAAKASVKFQSDWKSLSPNLVALRLHEILR